MIKTKHICPECNKIMFWNPKTQEWYCPDHPNHLTIKDLLKRRNKTLEE